MVDLPEPLGPAKTLRRLYDFNACYLITNFFCFTFTRVVDKSRTLCLAPSDDIR